MSERFVAYDPEFELFESQHEAGPGEGGRGLCKVATMTTAAELVNGLADAALDQFLRKLAACAACVPAHFCATSVGQMPDALWRVPTCGSDAALVSANLGGRVTTRAETQLGTRAAAQAGITAARRNAPGLLRPESRTSSLSAFGRNHHQEGGIHNIHRYVVASHSDAERFGAGTFGIGKSGPVEFAIGAFEYEQYESTAFAQEG